MSHAPLYRQLSRVVEAFRDLYPDVPATTLRVFFEVCVSPGSTGPELMRSIGIGQTSLSRHLSILSEYSWRGGDGLDLVELIEDPEDRRNKRTFLKPKGRALAIKVFAIMDPKGTPPTHEDFPTATSYVLAYRNRR